MLTNRSLEFSGGGEADMAGDGVACGDGGDVESAGVAGTPWFDEMRRHQSGPAAARHRGSLPQLVLGQRGSKRIDASRHANGLTQIRRIGHTPTGTER
jgi:Cu/Zn superoxide dismutase